MVTLAEDRRRRVARWLRGDRRTGDLDRIFADLRLVQPGRDSVREVGHFAAHRGERNRGIVLERAGDMQTSARWWWMQMQMTVPPTADHMREAGAANLAIMPDVRIRERFGLTRQAPRLKFAKALKKHEAGRPLNLKERELAEALGLSMMWQIAFDEATLAGDLADLLVKDGALPSNRRGDIAGEVRFVGLFALALMHGAALKMPDGSLAPLRLAARTDTGALGIKAEIEVAEEPKPVMTSVSVFETSLPATDHCEPELLGPWGPSTPAEVEGDRIVAIR